MGYGRCTFQDNLSITPRHYAYRDWGDWATYKPWKCHTTSAVSKIKGWLKRVNNRIRRMEEKRDPENARVKDRYFFYAD